MDKRKHYTQMTNEETVAVLNAVRSNTYKFSPHAHERAMQKRVTETQVATMLGYGKVIEVHNNTASEVRVLMRGKVAGNWCNAVVSLTTKQVVTVFWNALNDTHRTLDKSQYKWSIDLKTVI
jgi:hypothetical protein